MRWIPILLLAALPCEAAVFRVTKTFDSNDRVCDQDCSLREAIAAANADESTGGADVVVIPPGIYRLSILGLEDANNAGDLDLYDSMVLVGSGPGSTVLSGGGFDRVLDVRAPLEIYGVTIRDGQAEGDGGGILIRPNLAIQPVVIHRSVITGNLALNGGSGGGIAAFNDLEVRDSTILENQAEGEGGGITGGEGGAISLTNVTVSGNFAAGSGGGLDYRVDLGSISGSTIVFNQAQVAGGGIAVRLSPVPTAHVIGSIVAENFAPVDADCSAADPVSQGYNVLGEGCEPGGNDRTGSQVVFRVPRTDLGPTPVHELLLNSPALDFVPASHCEASDQTGQSRQAPCDAGAREKADRPLCVPGGSVVCLQDGRFRVSATHGSNLPATAVPLTDDTGIHWFFGPENLEIMTKVLDGCAINQRWWMFTSGMTNVGVTLRVEDLDTGRIRQYVQDPGEVYEPRLDTSAFPCDAPALDDEAPAPGVPGPVTAVLRVTKTADTSDGICDRDCSLRDAVFASNLADDPNVIVLDPGIYALAAGDLDVEHSLLILGAGAGRTILDGGRIDRVLDVFRFGSLEAQDLTVRNGAAPEAEGGGIQSWGSLTLLRTVVEGNRADWGGGIYAFGQMILRDSTVSGNEAGIGGGGIYADGVVELENVTVSGNRAGEVGGGLFIAVFETVLRNVTVTANSAPTTGGLHADLVYECPGGPCPGQLELLRNVVAGNLGSNGPDCQVVHYSGGYNVFGVGAGCLPAASDRAGTTVHPLDPKLSPLGDHGGSTPTHVPLPGSPAIDLAPSCSGADQRGRPRPAGLCDAGAVERLPCCQPGSETLCLGQGDRFQITVNWATGTDSGPGMSLPLAADTGSFWFFDPANVELTVKVLNGCGVNQRYWVFLSGLTDVEVEVQVEDTTTGEIWTHRHAAGAPLQPRLDTEALEVCP